MTFLFFVVLFAKVASSGQNRPNADNVDNNKFSGCTKNNFPHYNCCSDFEDVSHKGLVKEITAVPQTLPRIICSYPGVPHKIARLIHNWAPLIKLDRNEVWRPSGTEHFLSNTKLEGCGQKPEPSSLTSSNLERCNANSYLTTKESLSCPSCTEPVFLRGQHPRNVPLNVIYREHKNFLEVAYWTFFPYNRGKRVCFGYVQKGCFLLGRIWGRCPCGENLGCIGEYSTFGHHVGDWERITVRFRKVNSDYRIYSIHLSIHGIDVTNKFGGEFLWQDGQFKKRDQTIAMYGGTHAVIYSSEGSHGMWPSAGRHEYKVLPNRDTLVDYTSSGLSWYTWERLKPVQYDPSGQYRGEFKFLGFKGRWGNRKQGCGIVGMAIGECQLNNGPETPSSFPAYQIENKL